jgi:hypothetical protein
VGASNTPIVSIVATDSNAAETGNDPGTFRISRSGGTVGALTVNYTIATGSGQATSADYTPTLTGLATIPSGQSSVDLTLTPVDDNLVEGAETVVMTLGDTGSYDVGSPATATVTIADNDPVNQPPTAVTLIGAVTALPEDAPTTNPIQLATISITDDGLGSNSLFLSGPDAASFQISGNTLFLKAGTVLNRASKPSYSIVVNVDDPAVGGTSDANVAFTLTINATSGGSDVPALPPLGSAALVLALAVTGWRSLSRRKN